MAVRLPAIDPSSTEEVLVPLSFCGSTRTIFDIIWSCLATIIACAWVAIHPNVPKSPEAWWKTIVRRAMVMFCAIVAPEFVIWWALRQWKGAKAIQSEFRSYVDDKKMWTLTHAHFLQMGGFVLCDHNKAPLEVVSAPTLAHLLSTNQISFPRITEQEILDKSKGDAFAKIVASLQTFWFIVQVIARAAQRLPVSELEILTLGYAILNAAVYFLWWSKPLNVACPIPVLLEPGANYPQTLKEKRARLKKLPELPPDATDEKNEYPATHDPTLEAQEFANDPKNDPSIFDRIPYPLQILICLFLIPLIPGLAIALLAIFLAIAVAIICIAIAVAIPFLAFASLMLALGCVTQAPLVLTIYNLGQMMFSGYIKPGAQHVPLYYAYDPTPRSQPHAPSFSLYMISGPLSDGDNLEDRSPTTEMGNPTYDESHLFICGALSIVFGAIHCVAWSFRFATPAEQILWRICALFITCIPLIYMIDAINRVILRGSGPRLAQNRYVGLILVLCWNLYATARLILLILAVVGLRRMSSEMFLAVRWVDFVPHY